MKVLLIRSIGYLPMKTTLYILLLSFVAAFCSKQNIQPVFDNTEPFPDRRTSVLYVIKAGNHHSEQNQLQVMHRSSMSAVVTFDSSAIYTSVDATNQGDINKLMGFSDCGTDHQQNSARIGWSWSGENLVLYAYSYFDRKRIIKTLGNFSLNIPIACSIKAENKYYYFKAGNITDSVSRFCADYEGNRYKLFPYFGGDETAPHEVRILITED